MRFWPLIAAAPLILGNGDPVVRTDHGAVRGQAIEQGAAFRGIPFAAPPVGPLRWREARPAHPWRGIRDARSLGAACIQPTRGEALPQSEDCLTLNVVTPDRHAKGLPVLVSIHGGAFAFGSGRYIADHDLSPIVRRGVVLVSPNYRVGRMGFFAHPALRAENGRATGNFWLSDQIAALRWVRDNIARFGGDPALVTVLGCSAGGSSVNALMAAPAARGLFAQASVHSGGGFFNASRPMALAEAQGQVFAQRAGARTLAQLRALSPAQVLAADPGPPDYGAMEDGRLVPMGVSQIFAAGRQAPVPMIVGSTSNEASVFGLMGFDAGVLRDRFGIDVAALRPIYERNGSLADAELLRRIQTDFIFTSASQGMAGLAARAAPTWSYHFAFVPQAERATSPGAPHCADMPYLFGLKTALDPEEARLSQAMQDYWYNFIATGNPGASWPAIRPGHPAPMVFNTASRVEPDFQRERLDYWWSRWLRESGSTIKP